MRDRFGAKNPRSWQLRFHTQTAGVSLTAQQPYNNVVRTALQAMAAVLGGTQSLHTNALDEALALPTAETATLALRTQQIIAHETGVTDVVDPVWRVVLRRDADERSSRRRRSTYFARIDAMGGMVEAIERGYPQREVAESAYRFQQALESRERIVVGVNDFVAEDEPPVGILYIDESAGEKQLAKLAALRQRRDNRARRAQPRSAAPGCRGQRQHDAAAVDAVRAYATIGEMCDALRVVWGEYVEDAVI